MKNFLELVLGIYASGMFFLNVLNCNLFSFSGKLKFSCLVCIISFFSQTKK